MLDTLNPIFYLHAYCNPLQQSLAERVVDLSETLHLNHYTWLEKGSPDNVERILAEQIQLGQIYEIQPLIDGDFY